MKCDMSKAIAIEQEEHPWADEKIARRLVEDHLRDDPGYYDDAAEGGEPEDGDPYPEEQPEHGRGHGKPELVIAIGAGKPKKGAEEGDPYPED